MILNSFYSIYAVLRAIQVAIFFQSDYNSSVMLESYAKPRSTPAPDFSAVRGRRLLIALSGGADSVALAAMLAEAREAYGLTLIAAHIDHCIRAESAGDAEFCRGLCDRLGIAFHTDRIDVPAEAMRNHWGLETAARHCRHRRLRQFLRETGADYIATAHHMDDQAETVLMHLARGSSLQGLCGMGVLDEDKRIYRPLLGWRKAELADYLRARGLEWREDATNRIPDNPRNALRLNVIPEIEKWYPGFAQAVWRLSCTARLESDLMDALTDRYLHDGGADGPFCAWLELNPPPHRAILRRAIRARSGADLSWEQVNALEALCRQPRGKLDIGPNAFAERTGSRLYFVRKAPPKIPEAALSLNGETRLWPLGRIIASPWTEGPIRDDPLRQALNPVALTGAVLRTRRPGDRIRPLGGGDKLLSDYFIDKKVDRPLRDATPLVAVGNRVHWVVGHGISREAALVPGCGAVELKYEENRQAIDRDPV